MTFSHPHFAEPHWLWLAVLGPLALLGLQWFSAWRRGQQLEQIAARPFLADLTRSHSPWRRGVKNALLVVAIAAVGLALARPQWGEREEGSQVLGEDIVFILDCSRSMLAADVKPNRLQRARLAIQDFMTRHTRSRLGLVAFAGQAFLQCPLTFDYSAFDETLRAVDDKTIPIPGTDIGAALDEGFRAMEKGEREKLLVVLTDGEDLEKGGVKKAEALAKEGVVVYTIGIGTPGGAEIQIFNEQGKPELLRDNKGEVVHSRLDEATLRQIAQATHGAYFPLGPLGEGLAKVRVALETRTSTSGTTPARRLGVDRFHVPIALLVLLLVAESLLGTRRRERPCRAPALGLLLALLWPAAGLGAVSNAPVALPRLAPVAPFPSVLAAAQANDIPVAEIDRLGEGNALNPGDSVTALVTLVQKKARRTQWLILVRAVAPDAKEQAKKPAAPMVMYTSLGNKFEFPPASAYVTARTLGPFPESGGRSKPSEKSARFAVDKGSLSLGLDQAMAALLRFRESGVKGNFAFSSKPVKEAEAAKGRKLAEEVHLTPEEERAICGSIPALFSYFNISQHTPGLQDILFKVVDMPSIWSMVRRGGVTADLAFQEERYSRADLSSWGLPGGPAAFHLPMRLDLNHQPALNVTLVVTSPRPPFLACGGIVGMLAENPGDNDEYLTMRIISATRAVIEP